MRRLPLGLAGHLSQEATTTCHCWRLTRRDGTVIGFTDHDRDLAFDATTYLAASGFSASDTEAATGLSVNADEVAGGFSSAAITEAELAAGRYDGARVERFLVNWAAPEQHALLSVREIGEVSRAGQQFRAELRSFAHRLDQPQGRVYDRRCDAALGDRRCGIDLSLWRGAAVVIAMPDRSRLLVGGLDGFAAGFFARGQVGLADGLAQIETHQRRSDGTAVLTLWLPLAQDIDPGTPVTVTAGCDKTFSTCRTRFANPLNFRGFPHLPGADFAYSYVDGERNHDGGPLFD